MRVSQPATAGPETGGSRPVPCSARRGLRCLASARIASTNRILASFVFFEPVFQLQLAPTTAGRGHMSALAREWERLLQEQGAARSCVCVCVCRYVCVCVCACVSVSVHVHVYVMRWLPGEQVFRTASRMPFSSAPPILFIRRPPESRRLPRSPRQGSWGPGPSRPSHPSRQMAAGPTEFPQTWWLAHMQDMEAPCSRWPGETRPRILRASRVCVFAVGHLPSRERSCACFQTLRRRKGCS